MNYDERLAQHMERERWDRIDIDRSALRDALAYRMTLNDAEERDITDADIAAILGRLEAEGIDTSDGCRVPGKPIFTRGERHHGDPPGTIRLRVTNPTVPADEPYPRGPRNGAIVAALSAIAVAVASL